MQMLKEPDFKALVDHHPRAIMLATPDARIIYVNRMFHAVTGYPSEDVLGRAPSVLSSGLHSQEFYQAMWQSLKECGRWEGLIWNRRKNGENYPQWLTIYSVEYHGNHLYVGVFMDVGELTAGNERLASLAYYDPLTELPNRSLFQEFLKARVSQHKSAGNCFAVLYIDLDFFKSVNDLHGHDRGDRVLQQAAACVQSVLRKGDVIASLKVAPEEFSVVYQPQYDLATSVMVGLEALLRWRHPELGAVSPMDFVPVAEQRGHIHELTEQLVRCISRDLDLGLVSETGSRRLAINISARQISDGRLERLLEPFFEGVRKAGWLPEIEITETHLMNLSRRCLAKLREFGEKGIVVAIDDFGTGYSSLAYLHTLPVQVLKIDRQFVQRLGPEGRDSSIVPAILAIAEALDLEVVAEGIETEAQRARLQALNCHRGQGYLMARPVPLAQLVLA